MDDPGLLNRFADGYGFFEGLRQGLVAVNVLSRRYCVEEQILVILVRRATVDDINIVSLQEFSVFG